MAGHLLPLGPAPWRFNAMAAAMGMALFFTLSGFLIVHFLALGAPLGNFLLKRLARIVPLCWAALAFLLLWKSYDSWTIIRNLLFVANLPPAALLEGGEHLWSLGVEMQFYMGVLGLCLLFGRRGLYLVIPLAAAVTAARILAGDTISIVTWHRVDEILAGGIIALVHAGWLGEKAGIILRRLPIWPFAIALLIASHPDGGPMQYLRPYAAALLVGSSLANAPLWLDRVMTSRPMVYIAEVSYALYVFHGVLVHTWLGTGDLIEKYLKRPLLFAATFALAHLSTRYFERPITRAVRRASNATGPVKTA